MNFLGFASVLGALFFGYIGSVAEEEKRDLSHVVSFLIASMSCLVMALLCFSGIFN